MQAYNSSFLINTSFIIPLHNYSVVTSLNTIQNSEDLTLSAICLQQPAPNVNVSAYFEVLTNKTHVILNLT